MATATNALEGRFEGRHAVRPEAVWRADAAELIELTRAG
jgi:hypothetical protein